MGASSVQLYTLLFAGINGTLLAEEQEIDITRTTNAQIVLTVAKGFAGVSPGAGMVDVEIQNAVPAGGFEFDMGRFMAGLIPVDVQVDGPGGKQMLGKAFVLKDSLRHGVNQEAKYAFSCTMALSMFA